MGHKQHPKILRMHTNASYDSCWFARNHREYAKFVKEDASIREMLNKKLEPAGVGAINIQRSGLNRLIIGLDVAKPGVVIGHKGKDIDALRLTLKKFVSQGGDVNVNVNEIRYPDAHPLCVANKIAQQLVARGSWRKLMKTALSFGMKSGLRGMTVICGGRLSAIARTEKKSEGTVSLSTFRDDIRQATVHAVTRSGTIGVRVIMSYDTKKVTQEVTYGPKRNDSPRKRFDDSRGGDRRGDRRHTPSSRDERKR